MGKKKHPETAFIFFSLAEHDTIQIYLGMESKYGDYYINKHLSVDVTQAIEKFLKGYLKYKGENVYNDHDLNKLCEDICKIDKNFVIHDKDCNLLNRYVKLRYEKRININKDEMIDILKCFKNIINYKPILDIRNEFKKKHNYINSENVEIKETMECFKYNQFENQFLKDRVKNTEVKTIDLIRIPDEIKDINLLYKSIYFNRNKPVFVLERKILIKNNNIIEGYKVDVWQFKNNFTSEQALQFEKEWDNNIKINNNKIQKK